MSFFFRNPNISWCPKHQFVRRFFSYQGDDYDNCLLISNDVIHSVRNSLALHRNDSIISTGLDGVSSKKTAIFIPVYLYFNQMA